jgi:hypothetical protein
MNDKKIEFSVYNEHELKIVISKLNTSQLGSLGEYLFAHYFKKKTNENLKSVHKNRADFSYRDHKIDVGASSRINQEMHLTKIRNKDASVIFFKDYCFIVNNFPQFDCQIKYKEINKLFQDWKKDRTLYLEKENDLKYKKELKEIKDEIGSFFKRYNYSPRIIHRTVSSIFGLRESPHNLLSNKINNKNITIYIDFKDYKISIKNINFIIAFPDSLENELPLQKRIALKGGSNITQKVDLQEIILIKHKCYFKNIQELKSNYFKNYPESI